MASVNSALQRARKTIHERLPARSQQSTLRAVGDTHARELVERFMKAWQRADIDTVAALLGRQRDVLDATVRELVARPPRDRGPIGPREVLLPAVALGTGAGQWTGGARLLPVRRSAR